jgi:hypothetical protein
MRRPTQFRERKPKLARTREGKETVIIEEKKENLTDEVDLNKQKGGIKAGSHDPIRGSPLVE